MIPWTLELKKHTFALKISRIRQRSVKKSQKETDSNLCTTQIGWLAFMAD